MTREELREATVLAIRTLRLHEDRVALKKTQETLARARKTLAAFLDSGLTDSERGTVGMVVASLRGEKAKLDEKRRRYMEAFEVSQAPQFDEDRFLDPLIAALAPIAEKKP